MEHTAFERGLSVSRRRVPRSSLADRKALPEIARQFACSREERTKLGRWSGSVAAAAFFVRSKVSLKGDRYAREGPAHDSELSFRFLVIARVSAFIGLAAWRDVVSLSAGRNRVFLFSVPPRGARLCFSFPVWFRSSGRLGWRIRRLLLAADPGEFSPPLFYFSPVRCGLRGFPPGGWAVFGVLAASGSRFVFSGL